MFFLNRNKSDERKKLINNQEKENNTSLNICQLLLDTNQKKSKNLYFIEAISVQEIIKREQKLFFTLFFHNASKFLTGIGKNSPITRPKMLTNYQRNVIRKKCHKKKTSIPNKSCLCDVYK